MPEARTFTREELYEQVWSKPLRTLAAELGISDVGLRKRCLRLFIPLPGEGYWNKKAAGHVVRRRPLTKIHPHAGGDSEALTFYSDAEATQTPQPIAIAQQIEFEAQPEHKIHVADNLLGAHRLISRTREALGHKGPIPPQHRVLEVSTSVAQRQRALRIMNALLRAFEHRGWSIAFGEGDDRRTYVHLLGERVGFGIYEPQHKVPLEAKPTYSWEKDWEYQYSGALVIRLYDPAYRHSSSERHIRESKTRPMEERLNDVMIAVVEDAVRQTERERQWAIDRAEREARERERAIAAERIRAENKRRSDGFAYLKRFQDARELRSLIEEVRTRVERDNLMDDTVREWLVWAEAFADDVDPYRELLKAIRAKTFGTSSL